MRNTRFFLLVIILFSFSLVSCKKKETAKDTFSSPKTLFVEYVSSFTAGYISKNAEISIKLAKPVEGIEPGKEIDTDLFSFEPGIKGTAYWADERTITFKPDKPLESGQQYQIVFALYKLVEVPQDRREFRFTFECIPQNFNLSFEGIGYYSVKDLTKVKLTGLIQTSDQANNEEIEKLITANQNGNQLSISFVHDVNINTHRFIIENVSRTEEEETVVIEWEGEAIGVDKAGKEKYEIPSLKDFKVTSVSLQRTGDRYISVKFSDPLDENQNLRGLVLLGNGLAPRVLIILNELKVYATSELTGEVSITIDRSVKNTAGYSLKENYLKTLQFSEQKPEVKITANKGVIMPGSEGLIVPFDAIGLSAVDLTVVRIFENNVLQYLQANDPGDNYEMVRVGRAVVKKTIPLGAVGATNLNEWNSFSVDLAEYMEAEPGAFYQVKIGFRKSYSLYFCPDSGSEFEDLPEENEDYQEETYWDEYDDYYYDWEQRDNPCHESYYMAHRGSEKVVFASNIGLIAKKADQGDLLVITTDIVSARPMSGVTIEAFDYQQQSIISGTTDNDGKVKLSPGRKPFVLVAKKGDQMGYLKMDDGSALSLSNFNITGAAVQNGVKGFIYGERGVWRPGDTLHISVMLEDIQNKLPEDHPVILELYNPMGQLQNRLVLTSGIEKLYAFHPVTAKDAPTGNWSAKVKVGGATFSERLKIETVKPNRLKINLKFDEEKLYAGDGSLYANLDVRWLHGAVAKNLNASYEVLLVPVKTVFKNYEDVSFDDPGKEFITENKPIFEGRLDENGKSRIPFKIEAGNEAPGMLKAVFKGKVFEEGGDFSIDNTSVTYVPYTSFVGVKAPQGDKRGMLVTDKDHKVRIVTLNDHGNPVDRKVEVSLYKLQWRWWWDNSYESISNYASSYYSEHISTKTVNTNNGEGAYTLKVEYPQWGRFMIVAKDEESGHSAGQIIYMDWPGWSGKQGRGELGGATMLDFNVEKESVSVGEFIRINMPSSAGGNALVSIETGTEVLETFWVDTKAENTVVEFEATSAMAPNIYAHITMLQPHAQTANDLPIRMYGVQAIEVSDPSTILKPVITMPDELRAEQEFTMEVSENGKKPMAYTIAIVEEGLLDLTKFKTPEPWKTFYAREALGIKTWDIFDDVMGAYGERLQKLMAVGGDDAIKAPEDKDANRFKPVVMFEGPFYMKAGQKMKHTFKLPQYIGSVRAMVVAGCDGAFGQTEKAVPVKQPLMILATLPRVAGPNEEIALPINVFAMDAKVKTVEVSVKTEGKLQLNGPEKQTINFNATGDQVVYFSMKAAPALGVGKVSVTAQSGDFKASYDVEMQVRASNPQISQVTEMMLEGGKSWKIDYKPLGLLTTNESMVEISSLPPINLEQRLKFLINYPHGCIEQTTSSIFAQLYLDELVELDNEKAQKVQQNVNVGITRIRSFQLADGGFSYWPGSSEPSLWGTNYAGHFLVEAQRQGYVVPDDLLQKWTSYQMEQANNWNATLYKDYHVQAYRLYTLALAGKPALGAMNRLKGVEIPNHTTKWTLASAYAVAGYPDAAVEIINGLTQEVKEYQELGGTYGSALRDQAMILETLTRLKKDTYAFEMLRKIAEKMGNANVWMSTQTTAYCLIAISEYAKNNKVDGGIKVAVDVFGTTFRVDGTKYLNQVTIVEPDKSGEINVSNKGDNPLFARLIKTGVPAEGAEKAAESNIKLEVVYKTLKGEVLDPANLKQGTDFMAEVTVMNPGLRDNYEELAITQIFPSGWEILNNRLDDTDQLVGGKKPEYLDIRDDRVLTYFDLPKNAKSTFKVYLNASYLGRFYQPAVYVEAMYDNGISANSVGQWVMVVK